MSHELVFLHFNDVYHISKRPPISRFLTALQTYRSKHTSNSPYTVFSGDIFSPSLEASILKGEHMLPILRELEVDVACAGNHDFDFGEDRLRRLASQTDFPWLLSNAIRENGNLLAGMQKYHTTTLQGFKIGFFGLAGTDWPSNCRELPPCKIHPPIKIAQNCSTYLRQVQKCDFVIALTHMRLAEDIQVSEALIHGEGRVDLLLGGHDHEVVRRYQGETLDSCLDPSLIDCNFSNEDVLADGSGFLPETKGAVRIIKSGTDWNALSCVKLKVERGSDGIANLLSITAEQIHDLEKVSLDPKVLAQNRSRVNESLRLIDKHIEQLGAQPLVHTAVPLEGTGWIIRSKESNLCNMLADLVQAYYQTDIAFVNSGSVRCDRVIPATTLGRDPLTVRDLMDILPFDNGLVVKRISSAALLEALENSFSDSHTDGRFLQYCGMEVMADWTKAEGSRVCGAWHTPVNGVPYTRRRIQPEDDVFFTVAMVAFIADGFDGYSCFQDQETLVSEESAITDTQLLLRALGYWNSEEGAVAIQDDERIVKARQSIVNESRDGLPLVAPRSGGRIVFRPQQRQCKFA